MSIQQKLIKRYSFSDKIRNDLQQMKSEIRKMSDKFDTLMAQREEIMEKGQLYLNSSKCRVEQWKCKISHKRIVPPSISRNFYKIPLNY